MKYNMKNLVRMAALAVCGAMFIASCTDTWDDHYGDAATQTGAGGTTMHFLEANASEFADILKAAGYDVNLNSSQVFTILAPKNGSFDKNALLKMIAEGDKKGVVDRFIKNHIMLYNVSLNNDKHTVFLLNEKKVHFGTLADNTIEGVPVEQANIVCNNGIVHLLSDEIVYKPSVLEQLGDNYAQYLADNGLEDSDDIISLYTFLRMYDSDSLDPKRSVEFGQDEDGNIVYTDSFMVRYNRVLASLGAYIYREDSSYWAIDPGVEAYQKFYNEAVGYFKFNDAYAQDEARRDSMQKYLAQFNMIGDYFYNANINEAKVTDGALSSKGDSLVSTNFSRWNWKYHNYKDVFTDNGILGNIDQQQECSNGYVFTLPKTDDNTQPISVYDAFFHDIKIEANPTLIVPGPRNSSGPVTEEWTDVKSFNAVYHSTSNDTVSNGYCRIEAPSAIRKPDLSFKLSNTLSGTYDIYICVLPWNVYNPDIDPELMIPVKFKVKLYEADEHNDIPYKPNDVNVHNFTPGSADYIQCWKDKNTALVDTVFIGTHTFKYCYQYTGASSSYLKLSLERSTTERNHKPYPLFDNRFLLDFILLKPHREEPQEPVEPDEPFNAPERTPDPFIHH